MIKKIVMVNSAGEMIVFASTLPLQKIWSYYHDSHNIYYLLPGHTNLMRMDGDDFVGDLI
jgi:hypothetical protein